MGSGDDINLKFLNFLLFGNGLFLTLNRPFHLILLYGLLPWSYAAFLYYLQKRQFRVLAESTYRTYKTSARPACFTASSAIETRINFSTQSLSTNDLVISVDWLHANLREPDLKVFAFIYQYPF